MGRINIHTDYIIAGRLWLSTAGIFAAGASLFFLITGEIKAAEVLITLGFVAACIGSLPAFFILYKAISLIEQGNRTVRQKIIKLVVICLFTTLLYALVPASISIIGYDDYHWLEFLETMGISTGVLFAASLMSFYLNRKAIYSYFSQNINTGASTFLSIQPNTIIMEQHEQRMNEAKPATQNTQNKTLIKAGITGALILLLLIPVSFIQNLITERQERQEQIVKEVSSKWASAQTITTPYIVIPYTDSLSKGEQRNLVLLPDNLNVKSNVTPVERARSIYNVLLYRSQIDISGNFHFSLPKDVDGSKLLLNKAQLCVGISDFKGIEQQVTAKVSNTDVAMTPGLPISLDTNGLAAPLALTAADA